jgi:predicted lipoprotein with Yx(FWY)xxD motif
MKRQWIYMLLALMLLSISGFSAMAQDATEEPTEEMASTEEAMGEMTPTLSLSSSEELGDFLVGPDGMTVYLFTNDTPGVSNCSGDCATNWPPLTVGEEETPTLAEGVPGMVNAITREDGTRQVVYNGWPLYYWAQDTAPGDTTGQGVGEVWFVVSPPHVSLGGNAELGDFLVGPNGMTLYMFTNDTENTSNCYDQCATNWPPLLVDEGEEVSAQPGLVGEVGTTERTDGTVQVTFNGMPLYYWAQDTAPGDATGQGVGDVWFVVKPPTISLASTDLGDVVVGPNGMTLYMFTEDVDGVSVCYDRCAVAWPPLLVAEGEEIVAGQGVEGELSTTTRDDGTLQVVYNGYPLYYWWRDVVPGDTTGQDVQQVWYVMDGAGEIIFGTGE